MKKVLFAIIFVSFSYLLQAQTDTLVLIPKHEIGFAVGTFPLIALDHPKDRFLFADYAPGFISYNNYEDIGDEKMWHLGSYALNYNYHFNSKKSIGASLSWMGMHIDRYHIYYGGWSLFGGGSRPVDTVDGSGWNHYFALMGNYRRTYYRKNKVSLYWGIHFGASLCVRDKEILPKQTIHSFLSTTRNDEYFFDVAIHLNAFGIDIGEKHIFNMELGIGRLGIFRAGYKYRI
ncbi:MAG: hypothetical protein FWG85_00420 [Bacteroidetes bacterium]|nr:hypothetical protein [Bacteroidota bacterium]